MKDSGRTRPWTLKDSGRNEELRQGTTRGGEGEEGSEGVREGEGAKGVNAVSRGKSMEVTLSAAR